MAGFSDSANKRKRLTPQEVINIIDDHSDESVESSLFSSDSDIAEQLMNLINKHLLQ